MHSGWPQWKYKGFTTLQCAEIHPKIQEIARTSCSTALIDEDKILSEYI